MLENDYPYVAHRRNSCELEEWKGNTTKINLAYFINPDENAIIEWLVTFGPVNVGISVPPDMKPYTGGVYRPSDYDCQFNVGVAIALSLMKEGWIWLKFERGVLAKKICFMGKKFFHFFGGRIFP
jgi:hypothetical protein